jgi:Zn-dependent M32 family carboxypeptidase
MQEGNFEVLKNNVQQIIDFIAAKNAKEAANKLAEVSEELDEILDHSDDDEDLRELSKYQVLLNQLNQKIIALNGQAN